MFVLATGLAVIGSLGAIEDKAGPAAWLALIGGLIFALAGLAVLSGGGWLGGAVVFVHGTR